MNSRRTSTWYTNLAILPEPKIESIWIIYQWQSATSKIRRSQREAWNSWNEKKKNHVRESNFKKTFSSSFYSEKMRWGQGCCRPCWMLFIALHFSSHFKRIIFRTNHFITITKLATENILICCFPTTQGINIHRLLNVWKPVKN